MDFMIGRISPLKESSGGLRERFHFRQSRGRLIAPRFAREKWKTSSRLIARWTVRNCQTLFVSAQKVTLMRNSMPQEEEECIVRYRAVCFIFGFSVPPCCQLCLVGREGALGTFPERNIERSVTSRGIQDKHWFTCYLAGCERTGKSPLAFTRIF